MKKKLAVALALIMTLTAGVTVVVWGGTNTPGSESDPAVTKSYVDGKTQYAPVQVAMGKKVIGGEGTEIILRSGEATAIDNGANGISDVTGGKDLMMGQPVAANHLLLVPRGDGRGITAVTEIWIMVRGAYTIQ